MVDVKEDKEYRKINHTNVTTQESTGKYLLKTGCNLDNTARAPT
jgi:hypothetical protein